MPVTILASCHNHSVNPCVGVTRTVATFKVEELPYIYQNMDYELWDYETDTICTAKARFTVTSEADSVIWKINNSEYRTKKVTMVFPYPDADNVHIPITLIVFRKPHTDCFANDKTSPKIGSIILIQIKSRYLDIYLLSMKFLLKHFNGVY